MDNADGATQATLAQSGARLLVDYGSFGLWEVPDSRIQTLAGRASVQQRDDFDDIYVRTGKITTPSGVPTAPSNLRQSKVSGNQLWMVQFVGPVKPDWLDNLRALGIEIVIYMPNNAYVVWADGTGIKRLEALVGKDPTVQWTGAYEPAYRLEPSLQRLSGAQMTPVTIQYYRTANAAASWQVEPALGNPQLPVEPRGAATTDEVQDQIVAGNLTLRAILRPARIPDRPPPLPPALARGRMRLQRVPRARTTSPRATRRPRPKPAPPGPPNPPKGTPKGPWPPRPPLPIRSRGDREHRRRADPCRDHPTAS